jgi:hypothetical protein
MPFRGQGDTARYKRDHPVQMLNRHFTEWTEGHFVNDAKPYDLGPDSAFTLVPFVSARRPLADMGAPVLSLV